MESFTGEGTIKRSSRREGHDRGFMPQAPVGMAPGVEYAALGAGRQRRLETGENADALPTIDPHHERHRRIVPQIASPELKQASARY